MANPPDPCWSAVDAGIKRMNPRVIFATTVFDDVQTGPGMYAQYLWRAFRDDPEIEFHVVAPSFPHEHPRLHAIEPADRAGTLYHRVGRAALRLAAGRERETIVHGNAAHAMFGFLSYAGPLVVQVNDYEVAWFWRHMVGRFVNQGLRSLLSLIWRRRQERRVVGAATRIVCNSRWTRQRVLCAYHPAPERVITIYKAVDVSSFKRPAVLPPDPLPDRDRGGRLILVGTNWYIKGLDILLRALPRVAESFENVSLTVAGPEVRMANTKVKALSDRLGLSDRVDFLGRVPRRDLPALLWHSDVALLPSRREGFGVAALEAMAAALPVVASRIGGIPEIISSDDYGVLCEPANVQALVGGIRKVLGDAAYRRRLGQAGPLRVREFGLDRMIQGVRRLYLELCPRQAAGTTSGM